MYSYCEIYEEKIKYFIIYLLCNDSELDLTKITFVKGDKLDVIFSERKGYLAKIVDKGVKYSKETVLGNMSIGMLNLAQQLKDLTVYLLIYLRIILPLVMILLNL